MYNFWWELKQKTLLLSLKWSKTMCLTVCCMYLYLNWSLKYVLKAQFYPLYSTGLPVQSNSHRKYTRLVDGMSSIVCLILWKQENQSISLCLCAYWENDFLHNSQWVHLCESRARRENISQTRTSVSVNEPKSINCINTTRTRNWLNKGKEINMINIHYDAGRPRKIMTVLLGRREVTDAKRIFSSPQTERGRGGVKQARKARGFLQSISCCHHITFI